MKNPTTMFKNHVTVCKIQLKCAKSCDIVAKILKQCTVYINPAKYGKIPQKCAEILQLL